jgi:hypothetical protein
MEGNNHDIFKGTILKFDSRNQGQPQNLQREQGKPLGKDYATGLLKTG